MAPSLASQSPTTEYKESRKKKSEKRVCLDPKTHHSELLRIFLLNQNNMAAYQVSKVWQIHSLIGRVTPGLLIRDNDQVQFITQEGIQFNEPLSKIKKIKWPFLRMGLGFDAVINETKYQFSFAKPNPSAPELDDNLIDQLLRFTDSGRLWEAIKTFKNLKADKVTTKAWKEILKQ